MYENYTRQALPSKEYRELLGSALCVFNANVAFIIDNILSSDDSSNYNWYDLIDLEAGKLLIPIKNTIVKRSNEEIENLFKEIVDMRNRIIHSFQITIDSEQILATKTRVREGNKQFIITKEYLLDFIVKNQELSDVLHDYRGF